MLTTKTTKKGASQRQLRVAEEIRHTLSGIFMREEFADPAMHKVSLTVSEVRISPDLKNATAYVMPLGGVNKQGVLEALGRLSPQIRHLVSQKVMLRYSPRIHFRLDESYDEASRIDALLRSPEVVKDLNKPQGE